MVARPETISDLTKVSDEALRVILRRTIEPVRDANDRQREMATQIKRMANVFAEEMEQVGAKTISMTGNRLVEQGGWFTPDIYESFSHTPHWVLRELPPRLPSGDVRLAVVKQDGSLATIYVSQHFLREKGTYEATDTAAAQLQDAEPKLDLLVPRNTSETEESAAKFIDSWTDAFGRAAEYYVTKSRVGRN